MLSTSIRVQDALYGFKISKGEHISINSCHCEVAQFYVPHAKQAELTIKREYINRLSVVLLLDVFAVSGHPASSDERSGVKRSACERHGANFCDRFSWVTKMKAQRDLVKGTRVEPGLRFELRKFTIQFRDLTGILGEQLGHRFIQHATDFDKSDGVRRWQ
jgi:hypothetical protein